MALTDAALKAARPLQKTYRLYDERGLYLEVASTGARYWRLKYRFAGKEKRLALGVYPEVGLKDARFARDDARLILREGRDPGAERKRSKYERTAAEVAAASTFKAVALEWLEKHTPRWSAGHAETVRERLEANIYPWLGSQPIDGIDAATLLQSIQRIDERGAREVARRVLQVCSQIFRYAVATGRASRDPAADLRGAIAPRAARHHASITDPTGVAGLLKAIDGYQGRLDTRCALKLAPLVFVRPGELRHAEWSEIELDLDAKEWRLPAHKMKRRIAHLVPLSRQAVAILTELKPLTGSGRYLFPSIRGADRPMSDNTLNAALRRMGYSKEDMTAHGFRTMASTLLNERGYSRDAIERQLAHMERDKVRAAYNRAQHLPERRRMMQEWADYLDFLKSGNLPLPQEQGIAVSDLLTTGSNPGP